MKRCCFKYLNAILITAYEEYVVHINNQINAPTQRVMLVENCIIYFTPKHPKLPNNIAKMPKPYLRRLF